MVEQALDEVEIRACLAGEPPGLRFEGDELDVQPLPPNRIVDVPEAIAEATSSARRAGGASNSRSTWAFRSAGPK